MQIKDYELINNISSLFESSIILLGFGDIGQKIYNLMKNAALKINYIYDRKLNYKHFCDATIIELENLPDILDSNRCIIIIGTKLYKDELINKLKELQLCCDVYTWYGIQAAIEWNIYDPRFPENFRINFLREKKTASERFWTQYWLSHFNAFESISNPIMIYQPAKVGSTTIQTSLNELNISNIHLHNFMVNLGKEKGLSNDIIDTTDKQIVCLHKRLLEEKIKIISLVRDPIARELSLFMQYFHEDYIMHNKHKAFLQYANEYINTNLLKNSEFEWFNHELKKFTGIDIYSYPFDREIGFTLIKEKNFEILILKTEKMTLNQHIIAEFVGQKSLPLKEKNVGNQKHYQYIYQGLKEAFRISPNTVDEIYFNNPYFNHFYTTEEKLFFFEKWKNNIGDYT